MPLRCHSDIKWNAVIRHGLLRALVPVFLLTITGLSIAMQQGQTEGPGRKRFALMLIGVRPRVSWEPSKRLEWQELFRNRPQSWRTYH